MWKSAALWPEPSIVRSSEDTHPTKEHAEAICKILHREGMGGERKIFPTQTFVMAPDGNATLVTSRRA